MTVAGILLYATGSGCEMLAKRVLLAAIIGLFPPAAPSPEYSIHAIRYASVPEYPVASLVMGATKDEKVEIAMVIWLIRGGGHTILFDSGFHRKEWFKSLPVRDYLRPDEAAVARSHSWTHERFLRWHHPGHRA